MIKCIHHPHCWTFNILYDGICCEILPTLGDCKEPRSQPYSTLVHLLKREGETPIELSPRNWIETDCLTWLSRIKDLPCPPGVLQSSSRNYCLSLAPWNGPFMPGWFQSPLGFRLVTKSQQTQHCPDGYLLISAVGCTFAWQGYIVGDSVPPNLSKSVCGGVGLCSTVLNINALLVDIALVTTYPPFKKFTSWQAEFTAQLMLKCWSSIGLFVKYDVN